MSVMRPEYDLDSKIDKCQTVIGDVERDEDGKWINVPAGRCGGNIAWKTERIAEDYFEDQGICTSCGSLYTTGAHR